MSDLFRQVQDIALYTDSGEKCAAFNRMMEGRGLTARDARFLIPLLYDRDLSLRHEAALALLEFKSLLKDEEPYQLMLALQWFEKLIDCAKTEDKARDVVNLALTDPSPRLRQKILNVLDISYCRNFQERVRYHYARVDVLALEEAWQNGSDEEQNFIVELLKQAVNGENNTPFLKRRYAACLGRITGMEHLAGEVREMLTPYRPAKKKGRLLPAELPEAPADDLTLFVGQLQKQGLFIDGHRQFPRLSVGKTNQRIIYREPGVQTWPREQRLRRITAPPGLGLLRFDFVATEPTLLLHFLLSEHLLSLDELPGNDLYEAVADAPRPKVKRYVNRMINGGGGTPDFTLSSFGRRLAEALDNLGEEITRVMRHGELRTLGGRKIILEESCVNFRGKLMNRLIQGSASDFFNGAVMALNDRLRAAHQDVRICFLLFDEVWVSLPDGKRDALKDEIASCLEAQSDKMGLLTPVRTKVSREER